MKCSYCTLPAKAKCACIQSYMCQIHLGEHLVEKIGHSYDILAIDLGDERLYKLRSKIHENLNLIDRVKNEIMLKSKDLIKLIESLYNQTSIKLDGYSKSYLDIFYRNKFCQSEIQTIEHVEKMNLVSQKLDIGEFQRQVQLFYSKDFVSYNQLVDERKLEGFKNELSKVELSKVLNLGILIPKVPFPKVEAKIEAPIIRNETPYFSMPKFEAKIEAPIIRNETPYIPLPKLEAKIEAPKVKIEPPTPLLRVILKNRSSSSSSPSSSSSGKKIIGIKIEPPKPKIEQPKVKIEPLKPKIEPPKAKIEPPKVKIEPTRALLNMKVKNRSSSSSSSERPKAKIEPARQ